MTDEEKAALVVAQIANGLDEKLAESVGKLIGGLEARILVLEAMVAAHQAVLTKQPIPRPDWLTRDSFEPKPR